MEGQVGPAPLISVVIATRNAARSLPRCLESLRAQAFREFEVVVMDGASADGTVDLLKSSGDVVTTWRSSPDAGLYSAWNAALPCPKVLVMPSSSMIGGSLTPRWPCTK